MGINRDKVLASAIKLLQSGKFEKAIAEFQKLVEDDPKDVRTILKIGDTYVKMGRRTEALQSYERVATLYSEQGFYLKAVAVYKQMLRVDGNLPDVHLKLAELYQQLGLTSDCLQHYQQVAVFYEQQGRQTEALQILKRMVDLDPDNLPSRIKLAELFAQQGLGQEAIQEFRSAAEYLKQQERYEDYIRVAERLIYFDPSAIDVTRELAQLYLQRGEPKLALGKLQVCFKADPRNLETLALIAQAFLEMQQVPKTVSVYKEMARIYEANGQYDEAKAQWSRVLELDPSDAEAQAGLQGPKAVPMPTGLPGMAAGLPGQAAPGDGPAPTAHAAQAVAPAPAPAPRVDPEEEQIARILTETDVYVKYGLRDKAVEHLQKVFALRPSHIEAHEKLRQLYQQMGNRNAALEELRVLVQLAEQKGDPRRDGWAAELQALSSAAAAFAEDRPVTAEEEEVILLEEPQADVFIDPSMPDEPPIDALDAESGLPPDESLLEQKPEEPDLADIPDDAVLGEDALGDAPLSLEEDAIILAEDEDEPVELEPVFPASAVGAPAEVELEGDLSLEDADALVKEALRGIEGLEDDVAEAPAAAAPAEIVLDDEPPRPQRPAPLPIDDPLLDAGADELLAQAMAEGKGAPDKPDFGEFDPVASMSPELSDEASEGGPQIASTVIMGLSPEEMDEIRQFVEDAQAPSATLDRDAFEKIEGTEPELSDELEAAGGFDSFDEATIAIHSPMLDAGARPIFENQSAPSLSDPDPSPAACTDPSLGESLSDEEIDLDQVAAAAAQGLEALKDPDSQQDVVAPLPELASIPAAPPILDEPPPPPFTEPALGADEELPRQPTGIRGPGKLGFGDRAIGFEDDPATLFFPDELEEAEFFIQQDILDEAREILESIAEDIEDSARVKWMLARIEAKENGEPEPPAPWEERIIQEVAEEIGDLEDAGEPYVEATQQISVEEVLSQFKKGVTETVREDDAETHYNLGIAYREMGLYHDAIQEFRLAARAPSKEVDCLHLIGLTQLDMGEPEEALQSFEQALASAMANDKQKGVNEYERGVCLEALGRTAEALAAFERAQALGADMADLGPRIAKLKGQGKNGATSLAADGDPPHRRKNIDYV